MLKKNSLLKIPESHGNTAPEIQIEDEETNRTNDKKQEENLRLLTPMNCESLSTNKRV